MISKILKVTVIVFALGLFLSCNSDDDGPQEAPSVQFSASVNGASFRTDTPNAVLSNDGKLLTISATNDSSETITITIGSNSQQATVLTSQSYNTGDADIPSSITYSTGGVNFTTNAENVGTININDLDQTLNVIFGSFDGNLINLFDTSQTVSITTGSLTAVEFSVQ
jgi:hypothetical protein